MLKALSYTGWLQMDLLCAKNKKYTPNTLKQAELQIYTKFNNCSRLRTCTAPTCTWVDLQFEKGGADAHISAQKKSTLTVLPA